MKTEISKRVELDGRVFYVRYAHGEPLRIDERKIYKGPYSTEGVYNQTRWHASSHPRPKKPSSITYRVLEAAGAQP